MASVFLSFLFVFNVNNTHVFFFISVSFLSVFFCINSVVLHIGWDVYVVDKYGKETFEDYKYCSTFRDSVGGIGGYSIVIVIYQFLNEFQSMKLFVFLMLFVLLLQVYNYRTHYATMEIKDNG